MFKRTFAALTACDMGLLPGARCSILTDLTLGVQSVQAQLRKYVVDLLHARAVLVIREFQRQHHMHLPGVALKVSNSFDKTDMERNQMIAK